MSGDEAGIRAFSDMQTGLVTTGKTSPDVQDSTHYQMRREQENARTIRVQLKNGGAK
jgi:hypothetical protein